MMETDTAGFEVINQIRSERQFSKYKNIKDIPIIIMSDIAQVTNSRFSLDDKENFLPGNNSFLAKPVSFDVLIKKINELI